MKMFELIKDHIKDIKKIVFVTGPEYHKKVEFLHLEEKMDYGETMMQ